MQQYEDTYAEVCGHLVAVCGHICRSMRTHMHQYADTHAAGQQYLHVPTATAEFAPVSYVGIEDIVERSLLCSLRPHTRVA